MTTAVIEVMSGLKNADALKSKFGGMGLKVEGGAGHLEVKWNQDDENDKENARKLFDTLTGQWYRAFKMNPDGSTGEQVDEFDPTHGRYLLMPPLAGG